MTAWNTVDNTKSAGDPILAEEWNNLVDDIAAMAEGSSGAPSIVVPTALSTTETDALKVLAPDGSGGVEWQSRGVVYSGDVTSEGYLSTPEGFVIPHDLDWAAGDIYRLSYSRKTDPGDDNLLYGSQIIFCHQVGSNVYITARLIASDEFGPQVFIRSGDRIRIQVSSTNDHTDGAIYRYVLEIL